MGDTDQRETIQSALEHQQSGRLREAEALCRQVLAHAPEHAAALSLLGVIYCQLQRRDWGIGFAGRAVQVNPHVAAYHYHYAEAWLAIGEANQAILAYQKAIALDPARPEPYAGLGAALHRRGRWAESVAALRQAIALGFNQAGVHVDLAKSLLRCGKLDDAEATLGQAEKLQPQNAEIWQVRGEILGHRQQYPAAVTAFTRAAELAPNYARPHHGAGVVLALQGDFPAAAAAMERALKLDPDYPEANCGAGALLLRSGRPVEAIAYYEKAIATNPQYLEARADLALAYEKAGRMKDAAAQYEALAAVTTDEEFFRFQRASLGAGATPPTAPPALVARLFDKYARYFDEHLTKYLGYRAPQLVFQAVARTAPKPGLAILDLGCGTGLCGQLFKPLAAKLVGVDLSPAMIEKAQERGIYDRLMVADLLEITSVVSESFDLVLAGDVFCYIGDLTPVFQRVAKVLRPGSLFAFTVEVSDEGDYVLRQTRRYAHAPSYIRQLAQSQGYELLSLDRTALRQENQHEVEGLVAVLRYR
ncbi:MAG: tetratricopeptide repeat protein [Phycisphaerae bacterium]